MNNRLNKIKKMLLIKMKLRNKLDYYKKPEIYR